MKHQQPNQWIRDLGNDVYWTGVIDWDLRDFHGFATRRGGTYNAFLVLGPEPVLIDTVKAHLADRLLEKISAIIDPAKIKHFIVNHIEPDHSGGFPKIAAALPNAKIYATENALTGLEKYYGLPRDIQIVRTGEGLNAGGRQFQFVELPMVHWPDSMVTWMPEDKILFSSDAFGQFIATSERFDDELPEPPYHDAALYYANIVHPFNRYVVKTVQTLLKLGIEPKLICPDHGILWRGHIPGIIEHYTSWATGACAEGALVLYETMWGSTERMADVITQRLLSNGTPVDRLRIRNATMSELATAVMFHKAILLGSPTMNDGFYPVFGHLLAYLEGLGFPGNRFWGAFGSYGWGGGAVEKIHRWMKENRCRIITDPLQFRFRPSVDEEKKLLEFADAVTLQLEQGQPVLTGEDIDAL